MGEADQYGRVPLLSSLAASKTTLKDLRSAKTDLDAHLAATKPDSPDRQELADIRRKVEHRINEIEEEVKELELKQNTEEARAHQRIVNGFRRRQELLGRPAALFMRALGWWALLMLLLYFLLAFPIESKPVAGPAGDLPIESTLAGSAGDLVLTLRDYLARVTGTLPQDCLSQGQADVSGKSLPLLAQLFVSSPSNGCNWRHGDEDQLEIIFYAVHFLAALSPDVGAIQKFSLLLMILAYLEIAVIRRERQLADATLEEQCYPNGLTRSSDDESEWFSFFPRRRLALATMDDRKDPYVVIHSKLDALRSEMRMNRQNVGSMTMRFLDYISDVLSAGLTTESVDALGERSDRLEVGYRDHLLDRFWRLDYVVWLLPTVGFLGTIYGISTSLVQAKGIFGKSVDGAEGDVAGDFGQVVDALGIAFDTTAFALLLLALLIWRQKRTEGEVRDFGEKSARLVKNGLIGPMRDRSDFSDERLHREAVKLLDRLSPRQPADAPAAVVPEEPSPATSDTTETATPAGLETESASVTTPGPEASPGPETAEEDKG